MKTSHDWPMLLFDSGKIYKGLNPLSFTAWVNGDILNVLQVDSNHGVSLETLKKESANDNGYCRIYRLVKPGSHYPENPLLRWVKKKNLEPFLRESP